MTLFSPLGERSLLRESKSRNAALSRAAFLVPLFVSLVLGLHGLFGPNPVLVFPVYSWQQLVSFMVLLGLWVWMAVKWYRKLRDPLVWKWRPVREALVLLAIGLLFAYMGAFLGVAKILHSSKSHPGEITATVAGKHRPSRHMNCTHIAFEEFRFLSDALCVNASLFEAVEVGGRIRITGHLSRFGVAPDHIERVVKQ